MPILKLQQYIDTKQPIFMAGIGGISMSALAELLVSRGAVVTGSDRSRTEITAKLEALGIRIHYAHKAEHVTDAALVIRTAAIPDSNPEIQAARTAGVPVMERAQAWGEIMLEYDNVVCVAGTHGKTTTTSMISLAAMEAQADPTIMVGSVFPAIGGTLRIGANRYFIAESCEYCNSFLNFHPTIAVILNIEADHLDFFRDIHDIISSVREFCRKTPEDRGVLIVNGDDANAMAAVQETGRRVITFGTTDTQDVYPQNTSIKNGYYSFDVMYKGSLYTSVTLSVPGCHNMLNALACCAVSIFSGFDAAAVSAGLQAFQGSGRRFQLTGHFHGATIVDDYAHHPSEMTATLKAARQMGFRRIFCIFQPHTYTRTHALFDDFIAALKLCDYAVLVDIYAAREKNTIGISSKHLADKIDHAVYCPSLEAAASYVKSYAGEGDLILTMGAGDVYKVGGMLAE